MDNLLVFLYYFFKFLYTPSFLCPAYLFFIVYIVISFIYRNEFNNVTFVLDKTDDAKIYKPLLIKSTIAVCVMLILFVCNVDVCHRFSY